MACSISEAEGIQEGEGDMKDHSDISFIAFLMVCLCFGGCVACERLEKIDKKLGVLVEQTKPTKDPE